MTRFRNVLTLIFAITIVSQISPLHAGDAVPVLLWGGIDNSNSETSAINPFMKTTSEEFSEILNNVLKGQPPVLLLLKDNLCVEDITQHKEQLQLATSGGSYMYRPAVEQPLSAFKDLPSYNQTYDSDEDFISDGQLIVKPIGNLDSIPELYNAIKNVSPNLVAVLTGKLCGYRRSERLKRAALADTNSTDFFVRTERVLFYAKEHPRIKLSADDEFKTLPDPERKRVDSKGNDVILYMDFPSTDKAMGDMTLEFNFTVKSPGYYSLETVNHKMQTTNVLRTKTEITFPYNFSYHCSQNIVFQSSQNVSIVLNLKGLQVQVDADNFNDAYDCVGFTTIPIWTGIFVTAILALIMIWALTMIIDIRTMDRFDDPKGKTITISAQE